LGVSRSEAEGLKTIERRPNPVELPKLVFNRNKSDRLYLGEIKKGMSYNECRSKADRAEMKLKEKNRKLEVAFCCEEGKGRYGS
jgi:hypothetical protein